jgi:molybdopterin synthase catalytic subunit
MEQAALIARIRAHRQYGQVGMILTHQGVVRQTARSGQPVNELTVRVDRERLAEIIAEQKRRPGIVEILVEIEEGKRLVGEDIMLVVVAGDLRENCFPVLTDTVNAIKKDVTHKTEI